MIQKWVVMKTRIRWQGTPYYLAPQFGSAFRDILRLVQNCTTNPDATNPSPISAPTSKSSNITQKRPVEDGTVEESAKRTKVLPNAFSSKGSPPDQSPVVPKPNYTGATDTSGESLESADEELTRALIRSFLDDARGFLRLEFRVLDWTKSGLKTDLTIRYIRLPHCAAGRIRTTHFSVSTRVLTADSV